MIVSNKSSCENEDKFGLEASGNYKPSQILWRPPPKSRKTGIVKTTKYKGILKTPADKSKRKKKLKWTDKSQKGDLTAIKQFDPNVEYLAARKENVQKIGQMMQMRQLEEMLGISFGDDPAEMEGIMESIDWSSIMAGEEDSEEEEVYTPPPPPKKKRKRIVGKRKNNRKQNRRKQRTVRKRGRR